MVAAHDNRMAFPALSRRIDPITKARVGCGLMAGVSIAVGLGIIVVDGLLNPHARFRPFWIALGGVAFYGPGACLALAWWGLRAGRGWAVQIGLVAAVLQATLAAGATVYFAGFARPWSVLPMVEGMLWTAADVLVALQLRRALPWVRADVAERHGFEVLG